MPGFGKCIDAYSRTRADSNMGIIRVNQGAERDALTIGAGTDLTIEFWINPQVKSPNEQVILQKYTGGNYKVSFARGKINFLWFGSGAWRVAG